MQEGWAPNSASDLLLFEWVSMAQRNDKEQEMNWEEASQFLQNKIQFKLTPQTCENRYSILSGLCKFSPDVGNSDKCAFFETFLRSHRQETLKQADTFLMQIANAIPLEVEQVQQGKRDAELDLISENIAFYKQLIESFNFGVPSTIDQQQQQNQTAETTQALSVIEVEPIVMDERSESNQKIDNNPEQDEGGKQQEQEPLQLIENEEEEKETKKRQREHDESLDEKSPTKKKKNGNDTTTKKQKKKKEDIKLVSALNRNTKKAEMEENQKTINTFLRKECMIRVTRAQKKAEQSTPLTMVDSHSQQGIKTEEVLSEPQPSPLQPPIQQLPNAPEESSSTPSIVESTKAARSKKRTSSSTTLENVSTFPESKEKEDGDKKELIDWKAKEEEGSKQTAKATEPKQDSKSSKNKTKSVKKRKESTIKKAQEEEKLIPEITSATPDPLTTVEDKKRYLKKEMLRVITRLKSVKRCDIFKGPIDDAGFLEVVKRPIDLTTIGNQVESGEIDSVMELWRNLLLMFQNSQFYNKDDTSYHKDTTFMRQYVRESIIMDLFMTEAKIMGNAEIPNAIQLLYSDMWEKAKNKK